MLSTSLLRHYQSYLSGIKTALKPYPLYTQVSINRTLVELKRLNSKTIFIFYTTINRTLVELKQALCKLGSCSTIDYQSYLSGIKTRAHLRERKSQGAINRTLVELKRRIHV